MITPWSTDLTSIKDKFISPSKIYKLAYTNLMEIGMGGPVCGGCILHYLGSERIIKNWNIKFVELNYIHNMSEQSLCIYTGIKTRNFIGFSIKSALATNGILLARLETIDLKINERDLFDLVLNKINTATVLNLEEADFIRKLISHKIFQTITISNNAGVPFAWNELGTKVAIPIWDQSKSRIAIFNTKNYQLSIYEDSCLINHIIDFKDNIVYTKKNEFNLDIEPIRITLNFI